VENETAFADVRAEILVAAVDEGRDDVVLLNVHHRVLSRIQSPSRTIGKNFAWFTA
jgi:hypothetical protein